jgi:hypothetical protein
MLTMAQVTNVIIGVTGDQCIVNRNCLEYRHILYIEHLSWHDRISALIKVMQDFILLCCLYRVVATYRDNFSIFSLHPSQNLSGLLMKNYWCNLIQTLIGWSVPSVVVGNYQFNDFCQSYVPLMIFIFKVCLDCCS